MNRRHHGRRQLYGHQARAFPCAIILADPLLVVIRHFHAPGRYDGVPMSRSRPHPVLFMLTCMLCVVLVETVAQGARWQDEDRASREAEQLERVWDASLDVSTVRMSQFALVLHDYRARLFIEQQVLFTMMAEEDFAWYIEQIEVSQQQRDLAWSDWHVFLDAARTLKQAAYDQRPLRRAPGATLLSLGEALDDLQNAFLDGVADFLEPEQRDRATAVNRALRRRTIMERMQTFPGTHDMLTAGDRMDLVAVVEEVLGEGEVVVTDRDRFDDVMREYELTLDQLLREGLAAHRGSRLRYHAATSQPEPQREQLVRLWREDQRLWRQRFDLLDRTAREVVALTEPPELLRRRLDERMFPAIYRAREAAFWRWIDGLLETDEHRHEVVTIRRDFERAIREKRDQLRAHIVSARRDDDPFTLRSAVSYTYLDPRSGRETRALDAEAEQPMNIIPQLMLQELSRPAREMLVRLQALLDLDNNQWSRGWMLLEGGEGVW